MNPKVPDAKTIWAFRGLLTGPGSIKGLFARFERAMSVQVVDSSFRPKTAIKGKCARKIWPDTPPRRASISVPEWQESEGASGIAISTLGYKSHTSIGKRHRFITTNRCPNNPRTS